MGAIGPVDERILVTGGAGFIGSHLAEALLPENEVIVYDALIEGARSRVPQEATVIEADIRDPNRVSEAVAGADRIYHQAALVSVERSVESPLVSHDINVRGTLSLLEAARRHDVPVVLASSAAIYGEPNEVPVTESARVRPRSPYGLEKATIDRYAHLYHEQYGLDTVSLRYFNAYGPGQGAGAYAGVIAAFAKQAAAGDPITVEGDGTQTRDFVHVSDIVQANLRAATTPEAIGKAFNVGTGTATSIRELAASVKRQSASDTEVVHVDARPGDISESVADISSARDVLGYDPTVELKDGLGSVLNSRRVPSSGQSRVGFR